MSVSCCGNRDEHIDKFAGKSILDESPFDVVGTKPAAANGPQPASPMPTPIPVTESAPQKEAKKVLLEHRQVSVKSFQEATGFHRNSHVGVYLAEPPESEEGELAMVCERSNDPHAFVT